MKVKSSVRLTHVVVAQHDSFWVPSGSRRIDEAAALVGSEAADRSIQRLLGHVLPQLHELCPLQKHTRSIGVSESRPD